MENQFAGAVGDPVINVGDYWQWSGRVDHRFNDKHTLMGRYMFDDRATVTGQAVPPGLTSSTPAGRHALAVSFNSPLSSTMFNELRANFQRLNSVTSAAGQKALTIPNIEIAELGSTTAAGASRATPTAATAASSWAYATRSNSHREFLDSAPRSGSQGRGGVSIIGL